ncbi:MAG: hypothetical protein KKA19_09305, partial [Candidatus Margulisbacteria bacterium]|nr:hypothetical protein [Candidatus Margulisiibacteriota bacterium]
IIKKEINLFESRTGHNPTIEDLAKLTSLNEKQIRYILKLCDEKLDEFHLDKPIENGKKNIQNINIADKTNILEERLAKKISHEELIALINRCDFSKKQKHIFILKTFGVNSFIFQDLELNKIENILFKRHLRKMREWPGLEEKFSYTEQELIDVYGGTKQGVNFLYQRAILKIRKQLNRYYSFFY